MGQLFWVGVGVVLSFAASVLANLIHPRFVDFLENQKLLRQSKRFESAASFHKLIADLHSGKRDKYLYLMRMLVFVIVGATVSFTCLVGAGLIAYIHDALLPADTPIAKGAVWSIGLFFLSALMMAMYSLATVRYKQVHDALENFDKFDAEFKKKWAACAPT